jgi:hypothetical protein
VLDQPAQAERADRRAPRRLFVGQVPDREPQELAVLGQRRQQVGVFAGGDALRIGGHDRASLVLFRLFCVVIGTLETAAASF